MVSKITIFEPHLDGVQIGPASLDDEQSFDESGTGRERSDGRSLRRLLIGTGVLAGVLVLGASLVRRARRSDDGSDEDESMDVVLEEDSLADAPAQ